MQKIINLDGILKELSDTVLSAASALEQKERVIAMDDYEALKARFVKYVYQFSVNALPIEALPAVLDNEKELIVNQLLSFTVMAAASAQAIANSLVDSFIQTVSAINTTEPFVAIVDNQAETFRASMNEPDQTLDKGHSQPLPVTSITYGAMFAGQLSPSDAVVVCNELGIGAIRMAISVDNWAGNSAAYKVYKAAGLKIEMNFSWRAMSDGLAKSPQPYPVGNELIEYRDCLDDVATTCPPDILTIENEEMADNYHSGTPEQYIAMLAVAVDVAFAKGIPVTNGGLTVSPGLIVAVYRDLVDNSRSVEAATVLNNCMKDDRIKYAAQHRGYNKDIESKVTEVGTLLSSYKKQNLFAVNLHFYEPMVQPSAFQSIFSKPPTAVTPGGLVNIVAYIQKMTNKPVISNETGVTVSSPDLVESLLREMNRNGVKTVFWFSAVSDSGKTKPLTDRLAPNALGERFAQIIKTL